MTRENDRMPIDMPRQLSISDFTYDLPDARIATHPLPQRDDSKLLVYRQGSITDTVFRQLPLHLPENALMVVNNTKVVEARLHFDTVQGAQVELFYLAPANQIDQSSAMAQLGDVEIKCYIGKARKWKPDEVLLRHDAASGLTIRAVLLGKTADYFTVRLSWTPRQLPFAQVLHLAGKIPLPPYLRRDANLADAERYQTVYAQLDGSVAAPTAGLHFTESVMHNLQQKGVRTERVTLHVGAGTFKPVQADTMAGHEMHGEYIDVHIDVLRQLMGHLPRPVVAVGTTSMRTLESLYWLGVQLYRQPEMPLNGLQVAQFEPYDHPSDVPVAEALAALLYALESQGMVRVLVQTHLMIAPGYRFRLVEGLITNFHQPQSTLLLLVAAFIGSDWRMVYQHALDHSYRFLSYGDSSLLWKAG